MSTGVLRLVTVSLLAASFGSPALLAAPDLVSSSINGEFLTEPGVDSSAYRVNDISPDGRFVLFTGTRSCNVYRKDSISGEVLTVFENTLDADSGYSWCNGAGISADGNIVAASPTQKLGEPVISCEPEDCSAPGAVVIYDYGDVVEVVQKNLVTNDVIEITRNWQTTGWQETPLSAWFQAGANLQFAAVFRELSADGDTALTVKPPFAYFQSPSAVPPGYSFDPVYTLAKFSTNSAKVIDTNLGNDTEQQLIVRDMRMDETGRNLLINGLRFFSIPREPPEELPEGCERGEDCLIHCDLPVSLPCLLFNRPRDGLWVYQPDTGNLIPLYEVEAVADGESISGPLPQITQADIAGNGEYVYFNLFQSPRLCFSSDGQACPEPPYIDDAPPPGPLGLHRIDIADGSITPMDSVCPDTVAAETLDPDNPILNFAACVHMQVSDDGASVILGTSSITSSLGRITPPEPYLPKLNLPDFTRTSPSFVRPPIHWHLFDLESNASHALGIADGIMYAAHNAVLAGTGDDWAFSSDSLAISDGWLMPNAVYAAETRPYVDLAVRIRRTPGKDHDGVRGYRATISNYSRRTANLVELRIGVTTPNGLADDPQLSLLNYDSCLVYDDTVLIVGGLAETVSLLPTEDSDTGTDDFDFTCAIGALQSGDSLIIHWDIATGDDDSYMVQASVSAAEADFFLLNNSDSTNSQRGGKSSALGWILLPLLALAGLRRRRH